MSIEPTLALVAVIGAVAIGVLLRFVLRRSQRRSTRWAPEESIRLKRIWTAVGEASVLKNVDPWGEVAAAHLERLNKQVETFDARVHRAAGDRQRIRWDGLRLYLDCMECLQQVSALLHQLTVADAAYYREVLQDEKSEASSTPPEDLARAKKELASIQGMEEQIQRELLKTENSIVAFDRALQLLWLRLDPTSVLIEAREDLRGTMKKGV